MTVLTIRTDKPEAEVGLYDDDVQLAYHTWQAHRELAETLHSVIRDVLHSQDKQLGDVEAIIVFKGPGSFTGLRIGITVANALADSLGIPIIGTTDPQWLETGIASLQNGGNDRIVLPEYGADPHITAPKH